MYTPLPRQRPCYSSFLDYRGVEKLTSSATLLLIRRAVVDGKLVEREPARSTLPVARHLYVTPDIARLLDGGRPDAGFPSPEATIITDRYMIGHLVVVSFSAKTDPPRAAPDMERMEGLEEAWVMCFRKPRPGWRLLGRFGAPGHFVALRAHDRHELKGKKVYEAKAKEMMGDWDILFPDTAPHQGYEAADYVSGVYRDVTK
jgi:hypothetical protein